MDQKSSYPHPEQQQQPEYNPNQQQNMYPNIPSANPPAYDAVPPAMSATVVHQTLVSIPFGPQPSNITCPSCQKQIATKIKHENATKTHMFALLCCLIFWPCVWLPYTMDSCKDVNHYCPYCDAYLGSYKN
uniref:CSON004293 protein n=1 Tax=Culicoides sonorensis TaxID=179676 RepID=A0A336MNT9_CULSO